LSSRTNINTLPRRRGQREFVALLGTFYTLGPEARDLRIDENTQQNIIPLRIDVRFCFDNNLIGLRPIHHPTDPNRLYIQMVDLKTLSKEHGFQTLGYDDDDKDISLTRVNTMEYTNTPPAGHAKHGDVYELSAANPEIYPLPSLTFLQIRYAMEKILCVLPGGRSELWNEKDADEEMAEGDSDEGVSKEEDEGVDEMYAGLVAMQLTP
jgi:hypothetical protein